MDLPTINERQMTDRKRISKIRFAISDAIDKICKEENFEITYAEIHAAILQVMENHSEQQLKTLWSEKPKTEE